MWINVEDLEIKKGTTIGAIGFLVGISYLDTGGERFVLRDAPARSIRSREPLLRGDCGTSNNVLTYAHGVFVITAINSAENRIRVERLPAAQACEWLESEGMGFLASREGDR